MEKINKLKNILIREKLDGYLISKNDEFFEEYTPSYKDRLKFISNFSGSSGFSLILRDKNYLFVDGRYSLQAQNQSGKNFKIITFPKKMPKDILRDKKFLIGYDSRFFTKNFFNLFFSKSKCIFIPINENLIDKIWKRRAISTRNKFYVLPNHSVGSSYKTKVKKIVSNLKKRGADYQFITASENIAWLLNIRGKDSNYTPLPQSYILIDKMENMIFFCDIKKLSKQFKKNFEKISFFKFKKVESILSSINNKKFIIDKITCSIYFENIILKKNNKLISKDPIYDFKAIKSNKEIENIKKAHVYDGAALTKYLFWVKKNFNKVKITEISGEKKLYNYRKKNKNFKFLSFPTISGTGPNGAIIHYKASKNTNRRLKEGDIYLVDSGGQYKFGTTDVTRTISLNNTNQRIKNIFTRVLKGHIAVADFKLRKNTCGNKIDFIARKYLKQIGLDYAHGTGHGVGYFLNVHEGPQAFSKNNKIKLQVGMIVSNEPGYYEKNKFGIRIENLIYVKKIQNRKVFANLTMVPIDKDLISQSLLDRNEKKWINNYHKKVFHTLKSKMSLEELLDLKHACSAI